MEHSDVLVQGLLVAVLMLGAIHSLKMFTQFWCVVLNELAALSKSLRRDIKELRRALVTVYRTWKDDA